MKQVLCSAIIIMMVTAIYLPAQNKKVTEKKEVTLKSQMEALHERFGVNFVYDSSIDLDIPCHEIKFDKTGLQLEDCLTIVFKDTGIGYKIMKKYIVLSRKGSGHKSKDYTIFIEEQHDTLDESVITALTDLDAIHLGFSPTTYIYTNVKGGLGVFAGASIYESEWYGF